MVEFAMVATLLLFLLMGILESGLLVFVISSARFAAGSGARVGSEVGAAANADALIVQTIRQTPMGTTTLAEVTEIDVFKVDYSPGTGDLVANSSLVNRYQLDGSLVLGTTQKWDPRVRKEDSNNADFLGVKILYTYHWKSGSLLGIPPFVTDATYWMRIEPQVYSTP